MPVPVTHLCPKCKGETRIEHGSCFPCFFTEMQHAAGQKTAAQHHYQHSQMVMISHRQRRRRLRQLRRRQAGLEE